MAIVQLAEVLLTNVHYAVESECAKVLEAGKEEGDLNKGNWTS